MLERVCGISDEGEGVEAVAAAVLLLPTHRITHEEVFGAVHNDLARQSKTKSGELFPP